MWKFKFRAAVFTLAVLGCGLELGAQGPGPICSANAVPPIVRSEGLAEIVADVVLSCSTLGQPPSQAYLQLNLSLSLNQNVTNNRDFGAGKDFTDAVLVTQENLGNPTTQSEFGGQDPRFPLPRYGSLASSNRLEWNGIDFPIPGGGDPAFPSVITLRITNVRARVNTGSIVALRAEQSSAISAFISITGPSSVLISHNVLNVGVPSEGLIEGYRNALNNGPALLEGSLQCVPQNINSGGAVQGPASFHVRVEEGFATAFKPLGEPTTTPGNSINEAGFPTPGSGVNGGGANQGSRFMLQFFNIPSGIRMAVRGQVFSGSAQAVQIVDFDGAGIGGGPAPGQGLRELPISNGFTRAVYEWVSGNPFAKEALDIPVVVGYNFAATGSMLALTDFAPFGFNGNSDGPSPEPRFRPTSNSTQVFRIEPCFPIPTPTISSLSPPAVSAGGQAFSLTVTGSGYRPTISDGEFSTPGSQVLWGGAELETTFVSESTLIATVPAGFIAEPATVNIHVRNFSDLLSNTVRLTVGSELSFLTPINLTGATVGVPYSLAFAATGGSPPYSFVQANPFNQLPPGLVLSAGGVLMGVPTVDGDYNVGIRVNDSSTGAEIGNFILAIAPRLRVTTNSQLPPGKVGEPLNITLDATGGRPGYSWMLVDGVLPPGTRFDSAGTLTGTPSRPGNFAFTVTVYDSFEVSASAVFNLAIDGPLQITSASALPPAVLGTTYSTTLIAGGGQPPVLFGLASGRLPAGLALSRATGEISGTPTAPGASTFTVEASDSNDDTDSKVFSIEVFDQLTITSPPILPVARPGEPYATQLMAVGGTQPFQWSLQSGELPDGLELFPTGAIEGTADAEGVVRFVAKVTDAEQLTAMKELRLAVSQNTGLSIGPPPPLPPGVVGETYSFPLTPEGGAPPYDWEIVAGALPLGLRLSDSGVVNGIPLEPGLSESVILLTDSTGGTAIATYQIRIDRRGDIPAEVSLSSPPLSFSFAQGAVSPKTRGFVLLNGGGMAANVDIQTSTQDGFNWLSVSTTSGLTTAVKPLSVVVQADPRGLPPGAFFGQIVVTGNALPDSTAVLPVQMTISRRRQFQQILPRGLTFTSVKGGGDAPELNVYIRNEGVEPMDWTASIFLRGAAGGQGVSVGAGVVPPGEASPLLISPRIGDVPAGVYEAVVRVEAPNAAGQFRLIPVRLNHLPDGSVPDPIVNPAGLLFTTSPTAPTTQRVRVTNIAAPDSQPLTLSVRQLSDGAGDPFSHSPSMSVIAPDNPLDIVVTADPAGLSPGVYETLLVLDFSTGLRRTVPLKLVVPAGASIGLKETNSARQQQGGCTPTSLVPSIDSFWGGFPSYGGAPGAMTVSVVDNCGAPLIPSGDVDVVVTFVGTGDAPLALDHLGDGVWEETVVLNWTGPAVINITARDGDRDLIGQATFETTLNAPLSDAPAIDPGGIVNAANYASQPLAPGNLVAIFGTAFAEPGVLSQAQSVPLPEVLDGTFIEAGPGLTLLPLLFVSPSQINAQLPTEYSAAAGPLDVLVTRQSSTAALPVELLLADARPGFFTIDASGSGDVIAQDQDARVISGSRTAEQNPGGRQSIRPGELVTFYGAGLGATNPSVPAGFAAGSDPLAFPAEEITLEIGGMSAAVLFAGLSPQFPAVYQINAFVPEGVACGDAEVVITAAGIASTEGVTLAIECVAEQQQSFIRPLR